MKNLTTLLAVLCCIISTANAQLAPTDPKHENHYNVAPFENDEIKIDFKNAHSQQDFTLVELNITNKTSDYIYVKGAESKFIYDHGTYQPKGTMLSKINFTIDPLKTESKTFKVTGDNRFHVDKLKLELNGFYKVSAKGNPVKVDNFQLPASKNSFTAGECNCTLEKSKQTTKQTDAEFKCVYMGKKVVFVDPTKLSVKLKDGQEFANNNHKDKMEVLMPGDDIKFTAVFNIPGKIADMQFSVLNINWNDTFSESEMVPVKAATVDFVFDEGVTLLKNK